MVNTQWATVLEFSFYFSPRKCNFLSMTYFSYTRRWLFCYDPAKHVRSEIKISYRGESWDDFLQWQIKAKTILTIPIYFYQRQCNFLQLLEEKDLFFKLLDSHLLQTMGTGLPFIQLCKENSHTVDIFYKLTYFT